METSGLSGGGGGLFSGIGSGMLGLEMPLHPHHNQQQQQPRNPQTSQNLSHLQNTPQMLGFSHHETDHSLHQQPVKQGYPFGSKAKQQSSLSDEDEHGFNLDDGSADAKKKVSPWQRMKWTDNMVRLLITAVYYIGDEGGSEGNGSDPSGKKKVGGLLQKKGKWKSVSMAMMEKGFYVSPQQCEDKFNDLNKRYKRVNDILGRGTACKVVENQSLLDSMDLSPKMKEEVRKLLNSKHLFFREMCAYHSSCGHGASAGASAGANQSPEVATEISQVQHQQAQQPQPCFHSSEAARIVGNSPNSGRIETEASKLAKVGSEDEDDNDDEDDEEDDDEDDDDDEAMDGHSRAHNGHGKEDDEDSHEKNSHKRPRMGAYAMSTTPLMQHLSCEVMNVIQDGSKSAWEKKHWMKMRLLQLEEQQVSYQYQAFQLEKQRLKWVKFSGKKQREMERAKLENERRRLENERMVLLLRQKELELVDLHQPQRRDPSNISG